MPLRVCIYDAVRIEFIGDQWENAGLAITKAWIQTLILTDIRHLVPL